MKSYCLVQNTSRTQFYVIPTKNVYQLDENKVLQPLNSNFYTEGEKCFVRGVNVGLGNAACFIIDTDGKIFLQFLSICKIIY